jgi:hypothetical protein
MSDLALDQPEYPRTWLLIDVVDRSPRLVGHEIVDLSPGAIELRHVARQMRGFAEPSDRWVKVGPRPGSPEPGDGHTHVLSFGRRDERDPRRTSVPAPRCPFGSRILTPATAAEIGLYFYGRQPAMFGFTAPDVHKPICTNAVGANAAVKATFWDPSHPVTRHDGRCNLVRSGQHAE